MHSLRQPANALSPTLGQERYDFLDVLRGFALIGIILANMILYSMYLFLPEQAKVGMDTYPLDRVLDFLELVFIEGKFYTIFSILFGVGFSILLNRTQAKGIVFQRFFLRRMFFLFLIGLAHAILFWHVDILIFYALCGLLLLFFRKMSNGTILLIAALLFLTPVIMKLTGVIPPGSFTGPRDILFDLFGFSRETRIETWTTGSIADILSLNLSSWFAQADYIITSGMIFKILGCFLLGFIIGRNEIYKNPDLFRPFIKRLGVLGIMLGIPVNVIFAATFESESWLFLLSSTVGILLLSVGYICVIALLWISIPYRKFLQHFAPVGRMALTNYIGQSVICSLIFYGTGLGLGGTMGPTYYLPIGIAVYVFQIIVSRLWLNHFQFGPLEWFWRSLTYGAWMPLKKKPIL